MPPHRVFAQKGFQRSTTKDIAEEADIAEGTIYNYFESKDDLLINLIDRIADLAYRREAYAHSLDKDVRQAVYDLMLERFTVIKQQNTLFLAILPELFASPHLCELYTERVMVPALRDLEEHLQARVERHQIGNIDVAMTVRLLSALGLGLEMMTILGDAKTQAMWDDTGSLVEVLTSAIFDGMLIPSAKPPDSAD